MIGKEEAFPVFGKVFHTFNFQRNIEFFHYASMKISPFTIPVFIENIVYFILFNNPFQPADYKTRKFLQKFRITFFNRRSKVNMFHSMMLTNMQLAWEYSNVSKSLCLAANETQT